MAAPLSITGPGALAAGPRAAGAGGDLAAGWRARLDALASRGPTRAGDLAAARAALGSPTTPAPVRASGIAPPVTPPAGAGEVARAALDGLDRARARLDAAVAAARGGQSFTASELLALQSDAYRFAQTVDLAARAVESGAQAVRQAVQTPLG